MSQNQRLSNVRRRLYFDADVEEEIAENNSKDDENLAAEESTNNNSQIQALTNNEEENNEVRITDLSRMNDFEKMKSMQRWNFDFENEVPLSGDWEWEKTSSAEKLSHKEKVVARFSNNDKNKEV